MKKTWLIWSLEHHAWWAPNSGGYTRSRTDAGRYSTEEALEIVSWANEGCHGDPYEAMVPVTEQTEQAEPKKEPTE